jgi:hypothetical protein
MYTSPHEFVSLGSESDVDDINLKVMLVLSITQLYDFRRTWSSFLIYTFYPPQFITCTGTDIDFCQSMKVRFCGLNRQFVGTVFQGKDL